MIFGIHVQKKFSLSYAWDKKKNCYIKKDDRYLMYIQKCKQKVQQQELLIQHLKYLPDITASYQSNSKANQSQNKWHASLATKNKQKERIPA